MMKNKSTAKKMIQQRAVVVAAARKKFIQSVLETQPSVESHQQAKTLGEMAASAKTAPFLTKYRVGAIPA
jgi:bifunctional N-acetylglucosamine-1-phosphate-uridyltransferase/glucosamine-1-phosphate-acetyltransferase GlmU-like protein